MAALTAHPGSCSWEQSPKRQSPASSAISANVLSSTSSSAQSCSSRIPGVSISRAPAGSGTSSRCVVVCRPRPFALISRVTSSSRPASRLTSVDLPTPDEPSSAIVRPGSRYGSSPSRPSPVSALSAISGTPSATDSTSASSNAGSSATSTLFATTTGVEPLSQAEVRYRSSRRAFRSPPNAVTRNTVSTFAATTCTTVCRPASLRVNAERRGSTASITALRSPSSGLTATQSPTAGSSSSPSFPAGTPPSRPSSVRSSHGPWWRAATRAGIRLSFSNGRNASAKKASQPRSCRFNAISFGLGTKKRPSGRGSSLRSREELASASGGSASEQLSHVEPPSVAGPPQGRRARTRRQWRARPGYWVTTRR